MANITDKITDTRNGARPVPTTAIEVRNAGGSSLKCGALTGWATASKVHFVTYKIDSNNAQIAGTQMDCSAIVSGQFLTQFTVIDGPDIGNAIGDVIEMLPTAAWGQDLADALTNEHYRTGAHKNITADTLTVGSITLNGVSLASVIYPVGALYIETTGVNPHTTFGFGTWEAHAKGQALVGKADAGTFVTGGATGGTESTTLTAAQSGSPAHAHSAGSYGAGAHTHNLQMEWGSNSYVNQSVPGNYNQLSNRNQPYSFACQGVGDHAHGIVVYNSSATDAVSAHTNLQPYLVVYVWRRTA